LAKSSNITSGCGGGGTNSGSLGNGVEVLTFDDVTLPERPKAKAEPPFPYRYNNNNSI
jgi:hypothetical protein